MMNGEADVEMFRMLYLRADHKLPPRWKNTAILSATTAQPTLKYIRNIFVNVLFSIYHSNRKPTL
jgi:hypothetical protein